ncbi:DUF1501 domain-containing protein [Planctomicrobium sp. SH661]|uniref:DUF1501 domain-containing protein n=1 Tax=Planctomicrobium sp. SH661 TaxID=3448124 RepID=UPI003F5BFB60
MRELMRGLNEIDRRSFLEYAAKTAFGLTVLPTLGRAVTAAEAAPGGKPRRLIYLYMSGAMSHLDTFDLKPGHENQGQTSGIQTSVAGCQIAEYMPTLASQFDKLAVIRSMYTKTADHEDGEYLMRTSYDQIATERHPSLGPWMQRLLGRQNKTLPDTVLISSPARHPGAGFLDPSFSPLPIGDPNRGLENTKAPEYLTEDSFDKRIALIDAFDKKFRSSHDVRKVKSYTDFYSEATALLSSGALKAFDLEEEKAEDRDRYGRNGFGQGCLLAKRLVENNVRCVEVTLGGWDMHANIYSGGNIPYRAGVLDKAIGSLLTDLSASGLLEETVVVLATEFGRSPEINYDVGRDHHPAAFSCVLAGAGIKGGQFYGKSDPEGVNVEEDGVEPADLNATIATALGLKTDTVIHSPTGRPFKVAHDGKPVQKILS